MPWKNHLQQCILNSLELSSQSFQYHELKGDVKQRIKLITRKRKFEHGTWFLLQMMISSLCQEYALLMSFSFSVLALTNFSLVHIKHPFFALWIRWPITCRCWFYFLMHYKYDAITWIEVSPFSATTSHVSLNFHFHLLFITIVY